MTMIQELMKNVNGSTFVGLDTETEPALKGGKTNPFKGRVRKVMVGASVMVFQNKSTNEVGPRKWGERIDGTPFVVHQGTMYLEVIFLKPGQVKYTVDGIECADPENITGLELDQEEANQGGLTNKVIIRTFKVASIKRLSINGKTYNL